MAITFCHQAALLSVTEGGENHWHVNEVLGEVADGGAVDWHAQPPGGSQRQTPALVGLAWKARNQRITELQNHTAPPANLTGKSTAKPCP